MHCQYWRKSYAIPHTPEQKNDETVAVRHHHLMSVFPGQARQIGPWLILQFGMSNAPFIGSAA
jgi:hypothetical protein